MRLILDIDSKKISVQMCMGHGLNDLVLVDDCVFEISVFNVEKSERVDFFFYIHNSEKSILKRINKILLLIKRDDFKNLEQF